MGNTVPIHNGSVLTQYLYRDQLKL